MVPRDYIVWLQGLFDMIGDRQPTEAEWTMIRERHNDQFGSVVINDMADRMAQDAKRVKENEYAAAVAQKRAMSAMLSASPVSYSNSNV